MDNDNSSKVGLSQTLKREIIAAYFRAFGRKIQFLPELHDRSFADEALILCNVYIDWLASGHYGGGRAGQNRKAFCRALTELSGNPIFGMFHPQILLEKTKTHFPRLVTAMEAIANTSAPEFLGESEVRRAIEASSMCDVEKKKALANLWRVSMANKTYKWCRNHLIHGPGYITVSFEQTTYQGKRDIRLDFELMYGALCNIFASVERLSVQTVQWFGNASYQHRG